MSTTLRCRARSTSRGPSEAKRKRQRLQVRSLACASAACRRVWWENVLQEGEQHSSRRPLFFA
jgi:hypothetical protein